MEAIDWRIVSVLLGMVTAWSAVLFWAVKWLLDRYQQHMDQRFEMLLASTSEEAQEWQRVERDLLTLRAELPQHYVRREDWIRFSSVIDAKLDALRAEQSVVVTRLEHVQTRLEQQQ